MKHTIYVEILPDGYWPNWSDGPFRSKLGRISKRQPRDGRRYVAVTVDVNHRKAFGTPQGIEVTTT